tara:strand:- start:787 stop:1326 length:540 start_codon:yes stop_codon:yes gene_type:complete
MKKRIDALEKGLEKIEKHFQIECNKCDGTGKPRTKTREPAKTGENIKCKECGGTGMLGDKMYALGVQIEAIRKDIRELKGNLNAHINRQTAEIRVLPEGNNPSLQGGNSKIKWENGWEDYTGVFFVDAEDEKEIVLAKARKHFEEYFNNGVYHRNKKLGIFLNGPRAGKKIIEQIETGE